MEEKLDFSLPQKRKTSFSHGMIFVLLLILAGLTAVNLFLRPSGQYSCPANAALSLSPQQTRELAAKLAERGLYTRAAKVWQEYLSAGKLSDIEHAKTLFQIGTLFEKAGSYDEAIEYYYRSETIAKISELEPQINAHIKDCFEKIGKFSALRYELMDRTSFSNAQNAESKTVAQIGAEKITGADLDAMVEEAIDNQLAPMAAFMTTEQLHKQKKKMLEQYNDPAAKQRFLQSRLTQEILYRQGLEDDLMKEPKTRRLIEEMTRNVLSRQLMNAELAGKVNITETDLQTYYQANKDKYVEPADSNDPNSVKRQKSFDQVRDQVASELVSLKSQDTQQELIKHLMDKYNVIIHTSVFTGADKEKNDK